MRRLTLRDLRNSRLPNILGVSPTSSQFTSFVNEAVERLMVRGHWEGSYQSVNLCVSEGCLTFPRQIESMSEISLCSSPVASKNMWYDYLPNVFGEFSTSSCACPGPSFVYQGNYPTFKDVTPGNKVIRAYYQNASDIGKKIHIFGYDENNQWIRTLDGSTMIDGFKLTLAAPFVDSTFDVNSITGVQKEATVANVLLYQVDLAGDQVQLGSYEPDETVAGYQRYKLSNFDHVRGCGCTSSCDVHSIKGIAKLSYLPVVNEWDYIYLNNYPAIKEMAQSIRFSEMDTPQAAQKVMFHQKRAIMELQNEQQTVHGNDKTPVRLNVFGTAVLSNQRIGRLM